MLARSADGTRANAERVTPEIILAHGRNQGAVYSWDDAQAVMGHRYYWPVEVEVDGDIIEYGPANTAGELQGSAWNVLHLPLVSR